MPPASPAPGPGGRSANHRTSELVKPFGELPGPVRVHGTLAVIRAFAPQLAEHERSAILNVLSVLSWLSFPDSGAYCAAKAEIIADEISKQVLAGLSAGVAGLYPQVA